MVLGAGDEDMGLRNDNYKGNLGSDGGTYYYICQNDIFFKIFIS